MEEEPARNFITFESQVRARARVKGEGSGEGLGLGSGLARV